MRETANYNFPVPERGDYAKIDTIAQTFDGIDTEMKRIEEKIDESEQTDTKVDNHIKDDLGHIRFIGGTNAPNAWVCTSDNILWDTSTPPKPKQGSAYRVFVNQTNASPIISLKVQSSDGTKVSSTFQVLNPDGSQLSANAFASGAIATVSFNGTNFFLQGSGSGVVEHNSATWATPGTFYWTVPKGVYRVFYRALGAGGGGGGNVVDSSYKGGGGGGSGAFSTGYFDCKPGDAIRVDVGKGGDYGQATGIVGQDGQAGGNSIIFLNNSSSSLWIYGGGGGGWAKGSSKGYGGEGARENARGTTGIMYQPSLSVATGKYVKRTPQAGFTELYYITGSAGREGDQASSAQYAPGGGGAGSPGDQGPGMPGGTKNGSWDYYYVPGDPGPGFYLTGYVGGRGANINDGNPHGVEGSKGSGGGGGGWQYSNSAGGRGGDGRIEFYW